MTSCIKYLYMPRVTFNAPMASREIGLFRKRCRVFWRFCVPRCSVLSFQEYAVDFQRPLHLCSPCLPRSATVHAPSVRYTHTPVGNQQPFSFHFLQPLDPRPCWRGLTTRDFLCYTLSKRLEGAHQSLIVFLPAESTHDFLIGLVGLFR